ncbi:degV family protein [Niallia circulans]|jgi:DegV family protein with EDD domain|uniref:DegV family protein n=1 Tax=Shouchella clausii TaxID=79880 RepID=UPI000D988816|nr:DegV family protein [Shouchella clausii]MCM3547894.1 DegV family protein [Shouchella clausii]SPU18176.1 degV family protein [Niallia circulans]
MANIKIVTDSTCDIDKQEMERLGITVVPLSIEIGGKTYRDGVDITKKEFATLLTAGGALPKSSQPPVGVFMDVYQRLLAEGEEVQVLSLHMTEALSGTVQSAQMAAAEMDGRVTVVDSHFISTALSFQVKEAAEMAAAGETMERILAEIEQIRAKTSLYIAVDTLEYLAKGGRIGKGKALLGSLLKIKPIAALKEGTYTPVATKRTYKQVVEFFTEKFHLETAGKKIGAVGIAHIEAEQLGKKIVDSLKKVRADLSVSILETSPIISTHTGPGAIALMYYTR